MQPPDPQVHLSIGSRLENIELAHIVVGESLKLLEVDEDTCYWIALAVREAVANAIRHGNKEDPDKKVELDFGIEDDEIVIRIRDEGEGFEPEKVRNPLDPENVLKPGGRGIFYMKSFMDGIEYSFRPNGGTELSLRKKLNAPAVGPTEQSEQSEETS